MSSPVAHGATLNVTTTNDGGAGSLRQAIADAAPGDTIEIPAGTYTLTTGAELVINKNLTLNGAGAENTIIQAATAPNVAASRVFNIAAGTVTISGVTVRNGNIGTDGGGIRNAGTLTLTDSTVSGNNTTSGFLGFGGGIINRGTMTVTNSTISNNATKTAGGGILNDGTLTMTNSTVSGNTSGSSGGGFSNQDTLILINSTISGNNAGRGGGIRETGIQTVLTNTIIAGNTAPDGPDCVSDVDPITSLGHNLIRNITGCAYTPATGDLVGDGANPIDPLLGPLQNNGGPTETHALGLGSPAIDTGDDSAAPAADQRGVPRPQGPQSDIGAFEVAVPQSGTLTVNVIDDTDDGVCDSSDCSLREAIEAAGSGDTIDFDIGSTITLILGQLVIDKDLTIIGPGAGDLTISGNNTSRIFEITAGNVAISGMTIQDGNAGFGNGGGIQNAGTLTLSDSTVSNNAGFFGGGGIVSSGTLTITNSTISGNAVITGGGGIWNNAGTMTLTNSVVSGNTATDATFGNGGGITSSGSLTLTNSTISGNTATFGGGGIHSGIDSSVTLDLINTTVSGNTVNVGGGGIWNNGSTMTLTGSTIDSNTAGGSGGGIFQFGGTLALTDTTVDNNTSSLRGGGIETSSGALTVTRSTFSNNSAGDNGGGIFMEFAASSVELVNSTISGNETQFGGGVQNSGGALIVTNSTVTNNTATASNGSGGIRTFGGTTTLVNSIVASNVSGGDCNQASTSQGHNLDSDGSCISDGVNGDITDASPGLGPLQNNGGPTETHVLLDGSPAIDAGDDAAAPATDQRAVPRPQGLQNDIGAYERGPDCGGVPSTIVGTPAGETIVGTIGVDVIVGLGGDDDIRGLRGNDIICVGPGNDEVRGGPGRDRIFGEEGDDTLRGNRGRDRLFGGGGDDELRGGFGNDVVVGGAGADLLNGGPGNDLLKGLGGNDRLRGRGGDDSAFGGDGDDSIACGAGNDNADGGPGTDTANANCEVTVGIP